MDQDFHYYGTYYAARTGGFDKDEATLIAKSANFVDFFHEGEYASYWKLITDSTPQTNYNVVAEMANPRYTFQAGMLGNFVAPEDGLWCSFHFTPGNYDDPDGTPSRTDVHGTDVAQQLPQFQKRDTTKGREELSSIYYSFGSSQKKYLDDLKFGAMLNRPQSALSRQLIKDTIACMMHPERLKTILQYAKGGDVILRTGGEASLRRLGLILLGIRAHVIADTWAHQDFCGLDNVMNTYWDVNYKPVSLSDFSSLFNPSHWGLGRQSVSYDAGFGWRTVVLGSMGKLGNNNLEAVPNGTAYLGHGWMGHFPDFSFVKYRYKPCWSDPRTIVERDNPQEYQYAWMELVSLFRQAAGKGFLKTSAPSYPESFNKARTAIKEPCNLEPGKTGRKSSANEWQKQFGDLPASVIDVDKEPDAHAVLGGMIEKSKNVTRYGTSYVNVTSDLYLFQVAADYHFHFVKHYLERHRIYTFSGAWSQQTSALSPDIARLCND